MGDFDWNALLGPPSYDYAQPTFTTASLSAPAPRVPSLVHSSASSPDSTESSEPSPHAHGNDIVVSHKRKSLPGQVTAPEGVAHKDARAGKEVQHSHDTQEGKPSESSPPCSRLDRHRPSSCSFDRVDQERQVEGTDQREAEGPESCRSEGFPRQEGEGVLASLRSYDAHASQHVKDLEDRVAELESQGKDRDSQNDNLRALVEQLRQENERLSAGKGTFAKSSFTFDVPSASSSTSNPSSASSSVSPSALMAPMAKLSPPVNFPAVAIGGLGADFLAELSGQPLRKPSLPSSSSSFSSSSAAAAAPIETSGAPISSFDLFTPNGEHVNFGGSMANASPMASFGDMGDWRDGTKLPELDDYFVGLGSPPTLHQPTPATTVSPIEETGPYKGVLPDADLTELCSDMKAKATCQEVRFGLSLFLDPSLRRNNQYARKALEDALKQDVSTHAQLTGGSTF